MLSDVLKHLDGHHSFYDFTDAVVTVRLKGTRDIYLDELDRLRKMPYAHLVGDYEELTEDVKALNRVIRLYSIEEDEAE